MITQKILDKAKTALEGEAQQFAERVAPFYKVMRWGWHDGEIPTVDDLYMTAMSLINNLKPSESTCVDAATGGIEAKVTFYAGTQSVHAVLAFIPEYSRSTFRVE